MSLQNLNGNESRFINQLLLKGPQRSDALAKAIGCVNSAVGHVGINLRAQGLVSSTNDGGNYQLWSLTARARELLDAAAVEAKAKAEKPFRVLQVSDSGITLFDQKYAKFDNAQNFANTNIDRQAPDVVNYVVTLHSSVKFVPPVAASREVVTY